jgi:hypothetical protein
MLIALQSPPINANSACLAPLLPLPCLILGPAPARRFKSLQKRALIEPRRKIEQKKQGKKIEYVQVGAQRSLCLADHCCIC